MANWNKKIIVEVRFPFTLNNGKCRHSWIRREITASDIWTGIDGYNWKAEINIDRARLLVIGKCTSKGINEYLETIWQPTTYKIEVHGTHDGIRPTDVAYKCRVISYE